MLTESDLTFLREVDARCNAAMTGIWEVVKKGRGLSIIARSGQFWYGICHCMHNNGKDAAFLVAARTDIPRLREIIDRLAGEQTVHAEWIDDMYFDEPVTRCTACKRGFAKGHRAERFPYCPNCGAKMDGERRKEPDDG